MRQQATSTKRVFANWYAIAGYLYVLHLNGASLAWEYLRRNTDYRNDWRHCDPASTVFAERWGLAFAEDPYRDAETVRPLWQFDAEQAVRIVADGSLRSERFSVWSIPGRKALLCEENRIVLTSFLPNRSVTMAIPSDVCDGERFAYVIESGSSARSRWRVVEHHIEALQAYASAKPYVVLPRPGRAAFLHMHALHALDGISEGASHREIASAAFGSERVEAHWHADSELRAQVRYWIRRGEAFMRGEYRSLLVRAGDGDKRR